MAKKTPKKATKTAAKKKVAVTALNKKSGATKSKSSAPLKKNAAAKKAGSQKAAQPKKAVKQAPKAAKKSAKAAKATKPAKNSKPVKSTTPVKKKVAGKAAKPVTEVKAQTGNKVKAASRKTVAPVKELKKAQLVKKAEETKPVKPEKTRPAKVEVKQTTGGKAKVPAQAETPAPAEKKMTQAQLKAAARKEREYRNSAEFKATLPVKKRYQEEVFEAYKPKKEVRTSKHIKFELEYFFNASNRLLYEFFSTASGLQDWFADDVRINRDGTLSFFWEGTEQKAKLLFKRDGVVARYKWIEEPSDTYFEFRIEVDDLTGDVAMIITDFAEDQQSVENAKMLWDSQVNALKHAIGAY